MPPTALSRTPTYAPVRTLFPASRLFAALSASSFFDWRSRHRAVVLHRRADATAHQKTISPSINSSASVFQPSTTATRARGATRLHAGLLAVLANDDGHGGGWDHAELGDDHGDVLGRHGVVRQVHHVQPARRPRLLCAARPSRPQMKGAANDPTPTPHDFHFTATDPYALPLPLAPNPNRAGVSPALALARERSKWGRRKAAAGGWPG